ncbi:hypothetical protein [Chryseobacterium luquanense]|uniref:Uncharacterized protein n=1 Tax=Chryseobacterium luquanense TaxID=2983766 RepID=A0ABT3Y210_9FLAO|nr:hypothetical protein [Chryseobacterium luquanense]MCX8532157.1 hypothetical protein [Chryseobacterium luquanense]
MKILKIINIVLLIATIYQFYNFKAISKYSISDAELNAEYFYEQGRITKLEYEKDIVNIEKEKEKIILYEKVNQILLIINILFFLYWVYLAASKKQ